VKDRPEGVTERELAHALAEGWGMTPASMVYAPVGAGSYHWVVDDRRGSRWFVNVDDLDHKSWLGDSRRTRLSGLRTNLKTALVLRDQGGLGFVAAPVLARDGEAAELFLPRYAVSVYPFIDGASGQFDDGLSDSSRIELIDLLAALHQVVPAWPVPVADSRLSLRDVLETALSEQDQPWSGGPFSQPSRALLTSVAEPIRDLLATFDRLAVRVAAAPHQVITHGEPHPGNLIRTKDGPRLIDWDTAGLAVPERDLWSVLGDTGAEAARYTAATGHEIDPDALWFYRIRWTLDDLAAFTGQLRARHGDTADAREAWLALRELAADAAEQAAGPATGPAPGR
jgi:spectinomycin phosphotransferase